MRAWVRGKSEPPKEEKQKNSFLEKFGMGEAGGTSDNEDKAKEPLWTRIVKLDFSFIIICEVILNYVCYFLSCTGLIF